MGPESNVLATHHLLPLRVKGNNNVRSDLSFRKYENKAIEFVINTSNHRVVFTPVRKWYLKVQSLECGVGDVNVFCISQYIR
jgi:hypothetical protein